MSDLEIVLSYARNHCVDKIMQLRWEGAGDCSHPAFIIEGLKNKTYDGSSTKIKFHATCNLYESDTSTIFKTAYDNLSNALSGANDDQQAYMRGGLDCSRDSHAIKQSAADIMFVRNIMLTTGGGSDSRTDDGTALQELHVKTLRNRSNSLTDIGQLKLGMSGMPGLISASQWTRQRTKVKNLFVGGKELIKVGKSLNMQTPNPKAWGFRDMDESVDVMKNSGSSLGKKPTYYMTFLK